MSTQYQQFKTLAKASRSLKRSPRGKDRDTTIGILADAFCDVELPSSPMQLSDDECVALTRDGAASLAEAFSAAAAVVRRGRDLDPTSYRKLAADTDPVWRQVAAANWDIVSQLESQRVALARDVVMEVVKAHERQARQHGFTVETAEILQKVHGDANDPDSGFTDAIEQVLTGLHLRVSHFRHALDQVIGEH